MSDVEGVVVGVFYNLIGVPYTKTGFDINGPVKGIGPSGLFLASPELDGFDAVRHNRRWLQDWISRSSLDFMIVYSPRVQTTDKPRM